MHFACLPTSFSGVPVTVPPGGFGRKFANWKESVGLRGCFGIFGMFHGYSMFPTTTAEAPRLETLSCLMLGKGGKGFRRSFSTPRWPTPPKGGRLEAGGSGGFVVWKDEDMTATYGCFLKWWYPQNNPKMIIFSRKNHGCWVPSF